MEKPQHHILVCASFRVAGEAKGVCHRKESVSLLQYLETEIVDRNLDARVSSTGCLKQCEHGPVMVVYPEGQWYGEVNEEKIDEILNALEEGRAAEGALA
ncbi:MAG: (2Fe-2S) ferredoxin domain-containing protein [Terriglobales bacterium]